MSTCLNEVLDVKLFWGSLTIFYLLWLSLSLLLLLDHLGGRHPVAEGRRGWRGRRRGQRVRCVRYCNERVKYSEGLNSE